MARIIVTSEQGRRPGASVLLDEQVPPDHLNNDHSAAQLIERLVAGQSPARRRQEREQRRGERSDTPRDAFPRALTA